MVREYIVHILSKDPELCVVGTAGNGEDAVKAVERLRPDVVTMDIHMPKMDGLEATRRIMASSPTPIVVVSGSADPDEVVTTFRAIDAGALAVLGRPPGLHHPNHDECAAKMVQTVKLMSEVKVVRRRLRAKLPADAGRDSSTALSHARNKVRIVALGASTGGPLVLQEILHALHRDFPLPVVVVQHMALGFLEGFVEWLSQVSSLPVELAADGQRLRPGHVYVAPDDVQMAVAPDRRIALDDMPPENGLRPSVSYLFRSLAQVYGGECAAVLLTGMGRDGASELRLLRERGALTMAQDQATSIVFGMPGEAVRLDAARLVLPPLGIATALNDVAAAIFKEKGPL